MVVQVTTHARGILIAPREGSSSATVGKRVRSRVPRENVLSFEGSFVVPAQLAYLIAQEFPLQEASWTPDAWNLAEAQRLSRARLGLSRLEVAEALTDPERSLSGYPQLGKLDKHQIEAVAAISAPSLLGLALFDEQGTGKTISALAAFDRLRESGKVLRLLVIAPKTVLGGWRSDCEKIFGNKYRIVIVMGSREHKRRKIHSSHDILLVGYETAAREKWLLKNLVASEPNSYMLVVDESYYVKNPSTARSRAVAELRPFCERAIILCGTPAPNSPIDVVNQVNITDGGIAFGSVSLPSREDEAEQKIREILGEAIYLRRLKEDVLPDLPGKEFERIHLDLMPVQRKLYDEAHDDLVLRVRSIDDRQFSRELASFIARRVALLQLCSHPGSLDPVYTEVPAKLHVLDALLKDLIENKGEKVVIWSFFRHTLEVIAQRFGRYGLARVDGSVAKVQDRIDAIERFQADPNTLIFLGNTAAAGAGITLTAARTAIYESFSNQAAHYMQSVDRIHRRGQERDVTYHVLLANDTIEEREFDRILRKERSGRDLLGDHYKEPMTRERFLFELGDLPDAHK